MSLLDDTIPIEIIVRARPCVVIGAGGEAAAKVDRLLRSGARVTWFLGGETEGISQEDGETGRFEESEEAVSGEKVSEARAEGRLTKVARPFEDVDASGAAIVFVAPEHEAAGARLARQGALVCTLDRPLASTFVNPAVAEKSGLRVSISTGGKAPALARRLREELERLLDDAELARFVREVAAAREALPQGSRAAPMRERVAGLQIEGRVLVPRGPA